MGPDQSSAEVYVTGVYDRTRILWRSLEGQYRTWPCRFSVLYGPVEFEPDLFFVGINPGFNPATLYDDEILRPPRHNEYASAEWPLAVRLRQMFGALGHSEWLNRSNGSNTIFFKSNALSADRKRPNGYYWSHNPLAIRRQLEAFSMVELRGLIDALQPKRIVALGLDAFERLAESSKTTLRNPTGRRLAAVGQARGLPLIGVIHPSGAQVSNVDRASIIDWIGTSLS